MALDERTLRKVLAEQQEQTERCIGSLKEDFDHKLDTVLEYVKDVPAMKMKQDLLFDKFSEITVDAEAAKNVIKDHEHRIQRLETR